ncbi:GerAB/ArcD/ProY family transporter [Bacillus sp. S14(2024)]|uniref:GerAB/ArcD/ProY family transporter n=1 Tax=Bacillus sp. S14(2024) TaxID=3162884 RepID=UPI003D20838C
MEQMKISGFQLFCMIFLFELGSAILIGMASTAMQDAWIVVLCGTLFGCMLSLVYIKLHEAYPIALFTTYIRKIWGSYVGWTLGLFYVSSFIYGAARVLRDFEELLVISAYQSTSFLTIGACMILCIMYAIYKGFEVFARVAELCLFLILFVLLIIIALEFVGGLVQFQNLQPTLENGWKPIFKALFPTSVTFPFGEMVVFTMFFPYLNHQNAAKKITIATVAVSGIILMVFTIINISILGTEGMVRSSFPILSAVSYINIAGFIQRIDILVIIIMVILGFFKIALYFFGAVIGSADLFRVKQPKQLIYPIGVMIVICSVIIAPNYIVHLHEGLRVVPYYISLPAQVVIPVLLLATVWIKKKIKAT